jgi:hypothetical protein
MCSGIGIYVDIQITEICRKPVETKGRGWNSGYRNIYTCNVRGGSRVSPRGGGGNRAGCGRQRCKAMSAVRLTGACTNKFMEYKGREIRGRDHGVVILEKQPYIAKEPRRGKSCRVTADQLATVCPGTIVHNMTNVNLCRVQKLS